MTAALSRAGSATPTGSIGRLPTIHVTPVSGIVFAVSEIRLRRDSAARLATKAVGKLGAGNWSVTDRGLQQATPWQVADLKASWFGDALVYDLCCGIGGDAIALARRGPVVAVDRDGEIAGCARHNLAQVPGAVAEVICGDVTALDLPAGASLHIDPDRRSLQGRTTSPQRYQPSWEQVSRLVSDAEAAVVKLAPAASIDGDSSRRCWISLQGTVREQSLLWGDSIRRAALTHAPRSAAILAADGRVTWFRPTIERSSPDIETTAEPARFLIDPDAAIRAAGLTTRFAAEFDLRWLDGPAGFLAAQGVSNHLAQCAVSGEVIWWGTADDRKLRRELRARNAFPHTIKVRGTGHDPAALIKRYRRCGEQPVTLWIGHWRRRGFAAFTAE